MIHVLLAASCSAQCGQALARLVYVVYRLVYHTWGFAGTMKLAGLGITGYGSARMVYLIRKPLEPFHGSIRLEGDHYVVYQYTPPRKPRR
jgi:hypothetical protein